MHPRALILLGIPVSDVTLEEVIQYVLQAIKSHTPQKTTYYVGMIGVDQILEIWGCRSIKNREFLSVLIKSFLVLPMEKRLYWLSKLLGNPLKSSINEWEFFDQMTEAIVKENLSVYFLGANESEVKSFIHALKQRHPKLKIIGAECPGIATEGLELKNAEDLDAVIVEEINRTSPDLLWVNLDCPKQEIWFKRVKRRLRIPVAIGLQEIFNSINHAPSFWQSLIGFCKRTWASFKFSLLSLPLIVFNSFFRFLYARDIARSLTVKDPSLFLSSQESFIVFRLPPVLNQDASDQLVWYFKGAFEHPRIIFDFREVRFIDLDGQSFLLNVMTRVWKEKKEIYAWGLASYLKFLLKLNRLWYLLNAYFYDHPQDFIRSFSGKEINRERLFLSIQQKKAHLIVSFFGVLGNQKNYSNYLENWIPMLEDKGCILDFTYCLAIDNRAMGFLLHLKDHQKANHKSLKICCLSPSLEREFELANVSDQFNFYATLEAALAEEL